MIRKFPRPSAANARTKCGSPSPCVTNWRAGMAGEIAGQSPDPSLSSAAGVAPRDGRVSHWRRPSAPYAGGLNLHNPAIARLFSGRRIA